MNAIAISDIPIRAAPEKVDGPDAVSSGRKPAPVSARREEGLQTQAQPSHEEVEHATQGVNAFLKSSGTHVQFSYNKDVKEMTVEVINDNTQEVIKTIPSKSLLDLAAKIDEMVGLFLDKKG